MSLLTNDSLRLAYRDAKDPSYYETAAVSFWLQLLQKEIFTAPAYFTDAQVPAQDNTLRKIDLTVSYYDTQLRKVHLLVIEVKRASATPADCETLEEQVYHAMSAHVEERELPHIYGIAAFGVRAQFFLYRATEDHLRDLDGTERKSRGPELRLYRDVGEEANGIWFKNNCMMMMNNGLNGQPLLDKNTIYARSHV